MNFLAIETATEYCSVALLAGDTLLERGELAPRRHAELVLPMAESLLAEAGLARSALDGIAMGRGPGAFTGVRLAVALAQGLAYALDRPVVAVSTLAALALQAPVGPTSVLALLDARMGELYAAAFARETDAGAVALDAERVAGPTDLGLPSDSRWRVVGNGWAAQGEAIRAHARGVTFEPDAAALWPRAREVLKLAVPEFAAGHGVPAAEALPVYLRNKVALTIAERAVGH